MTNFDQGLLSPYTLMGASILANRGNIGQGMIQGGLLSTQMAQQQQKAELARMQMQAMKDKMAQEAEQKKALDSFLPTLNPQQQSAARAFPSQFASQYMGQMFPQQQNPTAEMQNFQYGQSNPAFNQWVLDKKKAGAMNVNLPGDDKWNENRAKNISNWASTFDENILTNRRIMDSLQSLDKLGKQVDTGSLADMKLGLNKISEEFGLNVPVGNISNAEQFKAASNALVLELQKQQKGPQTDGDRAFMATTMPNLGTSGEANQQLINYNMSRIMLDNYFAGLAGEVEGMDTLARASNRKNQVTQLYRTTPAGTVMEINGVRQPITFKEFAAYGEKKGQQMSVILNEWIRETTR